ncbi:hypothetical protein HDF16_004061 [Granulicella aggregans]|uniref:Uncharacterized protein n=1 Tax=Granulicella aggregans TaxID=474949 RepID=A0A7W7ZGJ8_9BACT|nr:hypothetical protein [Granulicella aggregans]
MNTVFIGDGDGCSSTLFWEQSRCHGELASITKQLQVVPSRGPHSLLIQVELIHDLFPTVSGSPNHERIIQCAKTSIVASVGIHALFFVAGPQHETCVAP